MKAKEWFEIAASRESYTGLGKTHAEYRLGKMYFEGIDVVQDYDVALSWFSKKRRVIVTSWVVER